MRRRTYLPLLLIAAPGAMALGMANPASAASSNGVANKSASEIVTAASAATGAAKSFTFGGTTQQSGTTTNLKVSVSSSGKGQGTITISGQPVKLIKIGNTVYFSSTKAFWNKAAGTGAGSLFGTRWVAVPSTDSDFAGINTLLDESQVAGQFSDTSNTTFTNASGLPDPDQWTTARDLAVLIEAGYACSEIHLFDLFPQTFHMETVVKLRR